MAAQTEMQDLLRLLTTGRNKIPILTAMQRVKALQSASITPSISTIATTPLPALQAALSIDEKSAKSLLTACKNASKNPAKHPSAADAEAANKRVKSAYSLPGEPQTEEELEKSLELPAPSTDEERIENTTIHTNRAPLVLAWALQLLKYTMPGQALSGRLSLAQALVSANSKTKAESLGMREKSGTDEGRGWPKIKIMGREVGVLKRVGYTGGDAVKQEEGGVDIKGEDTNIAVKRNSKTGWSISTPITSRSSRFIARSIPITSPAHARSTIQTLLATNPDLATASHNITAFRVQDGRGQSIIEESNDDGEAGGGKHLLGNLRSNKIVGVLLLVTRWYGGIMLGPDRWRIMTQVSNDALAQRLQVTGVVGAQEQLWGLDLDALNSNSKSTVAKTSEMPIHRPEGARRYILKAFASPPQIAEEESKKKKKTTKMLEVEKEENLKLLMGALDLLFGSWVGHVSREELDRRAWGWYVQCRPEVQEGSRGWGEKGEMRLRDVLALRRKG